MNATERLLRVLNRQPVDRQPVTGFLVSITCELMEILNVSLPSGHYDPKAMAKLAAGAYEVCGLESIKLPFDMTVEAGALGAEIDDGSKDTLPRVRAPLYADPRELRLPEGLMHRGRIPVVIEAIQQAQKEHGGRIPVISSIVGPLTLAGMLFGIDTLFQWMLTDVEKFNESIEKVTDLCIAYGQDQINTGSHVLVVADPTSSGDLISPLQYSRFVLPHHSRLLRALRPPVVLHICGNITGQLPYVGGLDVAGLSFDHKTDTHEIMSRLKGRIALIGYVPTSLLLEGSPDEVDRYSSECLRTGVDVLNAGCAWPLATPLENIKAMVLAAKGQT